MKLIILAAGQGTRLRPFTENRPKALVELQGKSLLDWQLAAAQSAGISEIVIVGGYLAEQLYRPGIASVVNENFASTNMVQSLFCAKSHFGEDFIMAYGDIVYTSGILNLLLQATAPVSVVVDLHWREYWSERFEDIGSDAESLQFGPGNSIVSIGQHVSDVEKIEAQYIGMVRFQGVGVRWLTEAYESVQADGLKSACDGEMLTVDRIYMTDLLQVMADRWNCLSALPVKGGWLEIDSARDLEVARQYLKHGRLTR